jgi:uncharacterized protein
MTQADGGNGPLTHIHRLLRLAEKVGAELAYDRRVFAIAAYLHDWGAFPRYHRAGVDHALRSRQVAETDILLRMDLTDRQVVLILDAIERHDYRDPRPVTSAEALLLREADFLDFLGVIGIVRECTGELAPGPYDLAMRYQRILARRDALCGRFTLPRAREVAAERLARMAQCLDWLREESMGHL